MPNFLSDSQIQWASTYYKLAWFLINTWPNQSKLKLKIQNCSKMKQSEIRWNDGANSLFFKIDSIMFWFTISLFTKMVD